ncbi:MAG TPA: glycosyltransferase N-terminal domain-containing protein [Salinimicrobium sp.]|nr:glycosyltransferase N-terminal domain-containing protein [Salinimicrobium sp.]
MHSAYNLIANLTEKLLPAFASFNPKLKLFVQGRKDVFTNLKNKISAEDKVFWFHAASLGEYEQAVPIMEKVKKHFPQYKIVVSFFSASGYENKKHSKLADVITYLPLDTKKNVNDFLNLVHPEWALFIKYEFWPNYLRELQNRNIKTLLISGRFRENQAFFKSYGKWMQSYLKSFLHFFVQDEQSVQLLNSIGFKNVTLSGDSRFDRVANQLTQDNNLEFIEEFLEDKICFVAGSTWPADEELFLNYVNSAPKNVKFIIAPHEIVPGRINALQKKIKIPSILFSERRSENISDFQVFIIDTIGLLSRIYSYGDIAYVGGAAGKTGLHNILEPATFGIPIITGANIQNFPEALKLEKIAGLFSVRTEKEFNKLIDKLVNNDKFLSKTGMICGHFIQKNTGATACIVDYILKISEEN